jgi:hypothetical protein
MLKIETHCYFDGEHFFIVDNVKYAAKLFLPHYQRDTYDRNQLEKIIMPLIGTIRYHNHPARYQYPGAEIVKELQDLFGVALVPARFNTCYEIEWKGDRPSLIDNGVETIFVPSMITNFARFRTVMSGNLATPETSTSKT